ncbi:hypothetical protein [Novosphingobium terrae]|uniref:hypothetical protein n=1 Tax=Novosphingobium terrae TaxID=2726189 RepID=UPI001F137C6E|nr:hypothetical protein [Novosphingobium terrae]
MATGVALAFGLGAAPVAAQDLGQACVVSDEAGQVAARILAERLAERIGHPLPTQNCQNRIVLALEDDVGPLLPPALRARWLQAKAKGEGFSIRSLGPKAHPVLVLSAPDKRGLVYAAGWLLRSADARARLAVPAAFSTAPHYPTRMTQIGYRAKNNTYDAWDLKRFRRRIEDFALWGSSGVQVIAPVSDDAATSPLYPAPPLETLAGIGRIAHELGIDFALYYPNLGDYAAAAARQAEAEKLDALLKQLPMVDALYIPGGDPGHTPPDQLIPLMEHEAAILHARNPAATVWLSAQGFDAKDSAGFYAALPRRPSGLTGVFYGPQTRDPLDRQRASLPRDVPLLLYPDIGHAMHAQFPVARWSPAFALTEGREPIDPRPLDFTRIFKAQAPLSKGFITYSEGVNDDFNQFLWFALGWNPATRPETVARDYARMFIGDPRAARLPFALERNWQGDPARNRTIPATLRLADAIRPTAYADWRLDTLRYRAVYDALVQKRLIAAWQRQDQALHLLARARPGQAAQAVASARAQLEQPDGPAIAALHQRLSGLADDLWRKARLQLSVRLYGASNIERGANLDRAGVDLNDRVAIEKEMAQALQRPDEPARIAALHALADPQRKADHALYDDLGNPQAEPHLVRAKDTQAAPDLRDTAIDGIADRTPEDGWRMADITYAETLYDRPIRLHYTGLNPRRRYRLIARYAGEDYQLPMRLVANGTLELHGALNRTQNPMTVSIDIPPAATSHGVLDLAWTRPAGLGGSGRGHQIAQSWLIPLPLSNGDTP